MRTAARQSWASITVAALLVGMGTVATQAQESPVAPENLDFESPPGPTRQPVGWGGGGEGYEFAVDPQVRHQGKQSGRIRWAGVDQASASGFGTLTQGVAANGFRGKRVRYSGYVRTQDVSEGWVGLWMRVDGPEGMLAFDNMQTSNRAIVGTTDWKEYEIILDVPKGATAIVFGMLLGGKGTAWVDDLTLTPMGEAGPAVAPGLFQMRGEYAVIGGGGSGNLTFEETTPAGGFPQGWGGGGEGYELTVDTKDPHGGQQCGRIRFSGPDQPKQASFGSLTQSVPAKPFRGKRVRYSGYVRTQGVSEGWGGLWMRVDGPGGVHAFDSMQKSNRAIVGTTDWKEYEIILDVPREATEIVFGMLLSGKGTAWVDDLQLEAVGTLADTTQSHSSEQKSPSVPALPKLLFPMPLNYREQVPLTYELRTDPAEALTSVRVYEDHPGNFVVEAVLRPLAPGERVELRWNSIVLCAPRSFDDAPAAAPLPEQWPEEARPWLRATRCAQADNPRIRKVAEGIRGDDRDVLTIIRSTLKRLHTIYTAQQGRCTELDAVQALDYQGSCTSCANLASALLRANGIPTRILAGYSVIAGPHQTHYIVEAYVPGFGWYPIESTQLQAPWPPYRQMHVAIVPPEYEDRSELRFSAGGCVPFLSLTEHPDYDGTYSVMGLLAPGRNCDHVAEPWRNYPPDAPAAEWQSALQRARQRWQNWVSSKPGMDKDSCLATPLRPDALDGATDPVLLSGILAE